MKFFNIVAGILGIASAAQPNPPDWDDRFTKVLRPGDKYAQQEIDDIYDILGGHTPDFHGQFDYRRRAILLTQGYHQLNINVGFYTTVHGLGRTPKATSVKELRVDNGSFNFNLGALQNFWRSAENLQADGDTTWSVSQASPLRRVHIKGDLSLTQKNKDQPIPGYASGGFMADCKVDGNLDAGGQQQFMFRNIEFSSFSGHAWNYMHVGNTIAPEDHCQNYGGTANHVVADTPIIGEKPYIIESDNKWTLMKPHIEHNKQGNTPLWDQSEEIDFSKVFVSRPFNDPQEIQDALDQGLHIVLQPGIYNVTKPLHVSKSDTVILGLGMATIQAVDGLEAITVGAVDGVRIAGVLLQAGESNSPSLIRVGVKGYNGDYTNPTVLSDVFCRVGGTNPATGPDVMADNMMQIDSGNVIIDGTWLWRADHDVSGLVKNSRNPVQNGLVVNGNVVTGYGLASEHTLADLLVWNGDHGRAYFFQAEFPYDVDTSYGENGYTGYRVGNQVTNHTAFGVGVYSYFRDHPWVEVENSITTPRVAGINFYDSFSVFLAGGGIIKNVINQTGDSVFGGGMVKYVCDYNGSSNADSEKILQ